MKLFHMVRRGLVGRKRDTAILGSILFLAFLFLNLSSILLASFTESANLQRQALHGKWQLMYYGADEMGKARSAEVADCGAIRIIGSSKDGNLVGSIDEKVQELGGLKLVSGRLPRGEDEIVLVRGRMPSEPELGEEYRIAYQYTYMRGGSLFNDWESRRNAVIESLHAGETNPYTNETRTWEELHEMFLDYVHAHYDAEKNSVSIEFDADSAYWEPTYDYPLPPGYDLERFLAEAENDLLYEWATTILHPNPFFGLSDEEAAYRMSVVRTMPGGLFSHEGFLINVLNEGNEIVFNGWGYSDAVKAQKGGELQTSKALLYKTYTVVGYVAPYADHWDARGLTMPDAFVASEAADAQLRAIRRAEEDYYEGAPSWEPKEILLLQNPDEDWENVARQMMTVFSEVQKPYFKVEGLDEEGINEQQQGFIIGLDPETGEEKACEITQYGSVGYFLTDAKTENPFYISGDPRAELRWKEFSDALLPLQPESLTLEELETNNNHPLRLNQYSYPPSGSAERSLQTLCSGVLIGVAACAVFQVFWVQLRRRRMRLTTLMSVGATDLQIFWMLLLEILLLLLCAGALGTGLGFILARVLTKRMETVYTVQWNRLLGGMGLCVAAVLISAMIPMLLVLRTPLTGREQLSRHTLRLKSPKKHKRQTYGRIILRQMRTNRGRTWLQVAMSFLLAVICLLTVFFSHGSYAEYRRKVDNTAMPDYEIVVPYGMSLRALRTTLEDHPALTENMELSVSREAPNVWLRCSGLLETSPIVKALNRLSEDSFRSLPGGGTGMAVRVVGLEEEALTAFLARLPVGDLDLDAMKQGEACVVLVPRFEAEDGNLISREAEQNVLEKLRQDERAGYLLSLSYGALYRDVTEADPGLRPGDTVDLTAFTQKIVEEYRQESYVERSLRVEAVVSTLEPPLWPLSENGAAFVIVTGQPAVPALYPSANTRMTASQTKYHARMSKLFYPDCYGLTRFVISNREGADPVAMDTAAYDLAESLGVELTNYRLIKEREASTARNRQLLYLLLGVEMALVLSTLLYSAAGMAAEQDRFRYGLLQAIGMSNAQILRGQVLQSFGLAIVGAIGANLLVAAVQVFSALFSSRPHLTLLENLEAYPWKLHILVCIGFVFVYTLLQSIPFRNLGRVNVIENLRS